MSDFLPHEVIIEILLRLPVKTLVRFTSVCKSWNSIITNPSFITSHLNHTTLSNRISNNTHFPFLLLRCYCNHDIREQLVLRRDNETLDLYAKLEFPYRYSLGFRVVGSCNGLLCLDFYNKQIIKLYNPSISKSVSLPFPNIMSKRCFFDAHMFDLGFGYDAKTNDYKVVRLAYYKDGEYVSPMVELYSHKLGSWRLLENACLPDCNTIKLDWSHAFLNEAVHWVASVDDIDKFILSFDMGNEKFSKMELPTSLAGDFAIGVYGDSLSVLYNNYVSFIRIWVLKEYGVAESWSKLITIDMRDRLSRAVGFRQNGEIITITRAGDFVSYNLETGRVQDLPIPTTLHRRCVDTYMESLVLLDQQVNEVFRRKVQSCGVVEYKAVTVSLRDEESRKGESSKKSRRRKNRAVD